jgi:hypothetical protein
MIRGIVAMDLLTQPTAEKLVKNQEQINQLREVLNVTRLDAQNALVRRLVKKTQDGTLGQATVESGDTAAEEASNDMAEDDKVNFGDTINNYTTTAAEPAKSVVEKAASSVLPMILAAALGGGGLGAAAVALPSLLKKDPAPVVMTTDAGTQYALEFSDDGK